MSDDRVWVTVQQADGNLETWEGTETMAIPAAQVTAVKAQMAAHKRLGIQKGQKLDELAQYIVCLRDGTSLPNATGEGLTILPGTPREPLDEDTRTKDYPAKVAELSEGFTQAEIDEAVARLDANLEAGVSLDPTTAENVDPAHYE